MGDVSSREQELVLAERMSMRFFLCVGLASESDSDEAGGERGPVTGPFLSLSQTRRGASFVISMMLELCDGKGVCGAMEQKSGLRENGTKSRRCIHLFHLLLFHRAKHPKSVSPLPLIGHIIVCPTTWICPTSGNPLVSY